MGEKEKPIVPESGRHYEAGESNTETFGGQAVPTVREERWSDQALNGTIGANMVEYVDGEMVRDTLHREPMIVEVVPGPEPAKNPTGTIPERMHSTQEDDITHHAEDVNMHDAEVAQQNPPIIVES